MRGDSLEYFVHCLPRFHELIGKNGAVGVFDKDKCLIHINGSKVVLPVKPGDPVNKEGIVYQAMKEGRRVIRKFGREPEYSHIGISIPLKDAAGEPIGAIVASQPIEYDPLFDITYTADQINAGNLARRFPSSLGQLEIDRLAESFNKMLERLEESFTLERKAKEVMRRFISDASHELRTPLTSISGLLEVLLRGAVQDPGQLQKALASMHDETERLKKIVDDLFVLTKLERIPQTEFKESMLDKVILDMEPHLHVLSGGRELEFDIERNLVCIFDKDKIKQVIYNLFQNAIQNTDAQEGKISIRLFRHNQGFQISFCDNGPGISENHIPHIFDRFYRCESSRTRENGGAGLGLTIAKSIMELHGGTIGVNCQKEKGTTFYVWLPPVPPPEDRSFTTV